MSDALKPGLDEMIGALREVIDDGKPWYRHGALRAALDTLREHERVVTENKNLRESIDILGRQRNKFMEERNAARAELTEARAEVGKLKAGAANAAIAYEQQIKLLRAPPPEDAMEADRIATRFCADYYDSGKEEILRALRAAREAEREKYAAVVGALKRIWPWFEGEHYHDHPDAVFVRAALATLDDGGQR